MPARSAVGRPNRARPAAPTAEQRQALAELRLIAARGEGLRVHDHDGPTQPGELMHVEVSLRCSDMPRAQTGVVLHARERVILLLPADVPLQLPGAQVHHRRFATVAHVQWGHNICLYRSPATEWNPADGMYGFIDRLADWFRAAAADELNPVGEPLHPPVAYFDPTAGLVVVHANAPVPNGAPWRGAALLRRVHAHRSDLVAWLPLGGRWPRTPEAARAAAGVNDPDAVIILAPAVIAPRAIGYTEYPASAAALLAALADTGTPTPELLGLIRRVIAHNGQIVSSPSNAATNAATVTGNTGTSGVPLPMVVGDPTRGVAGPGGRRVPHLAVWSLPGIAEQMASLMPAYLYADPGVAMQVAEVIEVGNTVLAGMPTRWVPVDEARPQAAVRRDADTPADWLRGRRVLLLGAGALGAPIADMCARGGVAHLEIVDNGTVRHGVLVRQPYGDADLGEPKSAALAGRLRAEHPHLTVFGHSRDAATRLRGPTADLSFDLIIDATAHRVVRATLERDRRLRRDEWPVHITVLAGPTAARGVATVSARGASGGGADVLRRVGLAAHDEDVVHDKDPQNTDLGETMAPPGGLHGIATDFFPRTPPELFTPEPGCSDATFIGSAADAAALTGQLFGGALAALNEPAGPPMAALVVHTPAGPAAPQVPGPRWLSWTNDTLVDEPGGYELRLRAEACDALDSEVRASAARRPVTVETGGTLLGDVDDSIGVIWVDAATGPPPDSRLSTVGFRHGVDGLEELVGRHEHRSNGAVGFLGMWHTHPGTSPQPSTTDHAGMALLVSDLDHGPHRALMLILGGTHWPAYLAGTAAPEHAAQLVVRSSEPTAAPAPPASWATASWWSPVPSSTRRHGSAGTDESNTTALGGAAVSGLGMAFSGGGSRAAAFHLGALRALHDLEVLPQVRVLSGVSGGALMAALWAYHPGDFAEFDEAAVDLLRRGLHWDIVRHAARPGPLARSVLGSVANLARPGRTHAVRTTTRTDALAAALRERAFGDRTLDQITTTTDVVLTTTDLITGSAVRFGSRISSSSRLGRILDPWSVADAVAASAAYPAFLPAMERTLTVGTHDHPSQQVALLADGGLYDNLGLSVLEPDRSPEYTDHVYALEHLIACDAGRGPLTRKAPHVWPARMRRTAEILHERAQNQSRHRIHEWAQAGTIRGFTMAYLGMHDDRLPVPAPGLVPRERVVSYPTDFAAMSRTDLDALADRGEALIRALLPHYCPELLR